MARSSAAKNQASAKRNIGVWRGKRSGINNVVINMARKPASINQQIKA